MGLGAEDHGVTMHKTSLSHYDRFGGDTGHVGKSSEEWGAGLSASQTTNVM